MILGRRSRPLHWPRSVAVGAVLIFLAACGGSDDVGGGSSSLHSPVINYDEHDFARDPALLANPDDLVTLRLESPGGVERGYRQQTQGINSAYRLNLEANHIKFAGEMKAAELMQISGMKAVRLDQMS